MSNYDIALLLLVVFVLLPAAFWNFTAIGLLLVYCFVMVTGFSSAEPIPRIVLLYADLLVLAMIYMKPPAYNCYPYRSLAALLAATWQERSWCDRVIIAAFVAGAWPAYALLDGAVYWLALYWISVLQYLTAGIGALLNWRSAKALQAGTDYDPTESASLRLSWGPAGGT